MKRLSRFSFIAGAVVAAVSLVDFAPTSRSSAQAGPIIDALSGGYYGGYGPSYGYSSYGYTPYGYRAAPGYVYPSANAYGQPVAPYAGTPGTIYYSNQTRQEYNPYGYGSRFSGGSPTYNPYGYGGYRSYGGSPNFGHAYSPYGYGSYSRLRLLTSQGEMTCLAQSYS